MGEGGGYGRGGSSITSAPKPSSLAPPGDQSPARLGMVAASRAPVWGEAGSRWSHLKLGPRDQALSPARLFKAAAQNRRGGGAQGPGSGRWEKVSGGVPSPTKRKPVVGACWETTGPEARQRLAARPGGDLATPLHKCPHFSSSGAGRKKRPRRSPGEKGQPARDTMML